MDSAGTATQANAIYMDSMAAHIQQFKVQLQELATTLVDSDFVKKIVDIGSALVKFLDIAVKVFNYIGGFNTLSVTLITAVFPKVFPKILSFLTQAKNLIVNIFRSTALMGALLGNPVAIAASAAVAIALIKRAVDALTVTYDEQVEKVQQLTEEYDRMFGETSRYNQLLNMARKLTAEEQKELTILTAQKEAAEQRLKTEKEIEYDKFQKTYGPGAERWIENWTLEDGYSPIKTTADILALQSWEKELSTAIVQYQNHEMTLSEMSAFTAKFLDEHSEMYNNLKKYYDLGFNLSDSQLTMLDSYERMIDVYAKVNEEANNAVILAKRNLEDYVEKRKSSGDTMSEIARTEQYTKLTKAYADAVQEAGIIAESSFASQIKNITSVEDELASAQAAIEAYNRALESGEKDDALKSYADTYRSFIKDWEEGRTDSNKVKAALGMFTTDELQQAFGYDMQAIGDWMAGELYQSIFSEDAGDDYVGNFVNYLQKHAGEFGDAVAFKSGTNGGVSIAIKDYKQLADAMNMPVAALDAIIGALDISGTQLMMSSAQVQELAEWLGITSDEAETSANAIENWIKKLSETGEYDAIGIRRVLDVLQSVGYIDQTVDLSQFGASIATAISDTAALSQEIADVGETDIKTKAEIDTTSWDEAYKHILDNIAAVNGQRATVTVDENHNINYNYSFSVGTGKSTIKEADAIGTDKARGGLTLLGDEYSSDGSPKPELVVEDGSAHLAGVDGPTVENLKSGAVVYNNSDTKKILSGLKVHGNIPAHGRGTSYLRNETLKRQEVKAQEAAQKDAENFAAYLNTYYGATYTGSSGGSGSSGSGGGSSSSSSKDVETWFDIALREHKHLVAMEQESDQEYLSWLASAYQQAYAEGIIELEDFYSYQEEVHDGMKELFDDYLNDMQHTIDMLGHYENSQAEQISIYEKMILEVENKIAEARAYGLDDNDEYVQELQDQWWEYKDAVTDIQDEITENAKDAVDELVDYRLDMIKQELENEKDALDDRLDYLKEFYDKQKDLLQEQADAEDYEKEQKKKRKTVADLETQLAQLELDNSAWAKKKKLELEEDLNDAREELAAYERDHALQMAQDELDAQYEMAEEALNDQIDLVDEKLNDAKALYEQALADIKNGSAELYQEMIEYNNRYGDGRENTIVTMWESAYSALDSYYKLYKTAYNDINLANATGYQSNTDNWSNSPINGGTGLPGVPTLSQSNLPQPTSASSPSLAQGSYVDVKSGAKWYADSYGGGAWGYAHGGTIKYVNPGSTHPYNIDGAGWVRKEDIVGYAGGTSNAKGGLARLFEEDSEYVFQSGDGNTYKLMTPGSKVLNAKATDFLYNFANGGREILAKMAENSVKLQGLGSGGSAIGEIRMGDIIVNGNADEDTVSEIRRAQRESVDYMLKELSRLRK